MFGSVEDITLGFDNDNQSETIEDHGSDHAHEEGHDHADGHESHGDHGEHGDHHDHPHGDHVDHGHGHPHHGADHFESLAATKTSLPQSPTGNLVISLNNLTVQLTDQFCRA